ncbi:uncharacterized protein [Venturia canescens]|uniref:uncharacterized protein n=1 Tax=Venturia canescens TaxID=32260 RepID=UPI001C9C33E1|nr:uncharacterized protein LOC122417479 [Venturia canescens]XP_043286935.1 uncharacterized protein LOC122417479 [Venturia canescens]XP_043286936.1 uncharacterized protein LOC122417479 [Venturia canescens]XP_043286937.1 uncharacterized protein LOC122417479 [Venturia canescens]
MNSPLEHNFKDYNCKNSIIIEEDPTANNSPEADERDYENSVEDLPKCEICGEEFVTKKDLRSHIIVHLGEPRIVLKRCSGLKALKNKKEKDTYWLDPGTKGSLKLTLKKHQLVTGDTLKLKLKKSSKTKDFAVVKSQLELEHKEEASDSEEVAGDTDNVQMDDKEREEETDQQSYENVIVNEGEGYENEEDENYDEDEISNPLEDNEIASLEANEGDSGVGSDMANPSEREDQNVDDLQAVGERSFINNRHASTAEENEPEDTDALEATCRETIENLKKLGEHSSSRSLSNLGILQGADDDNSMEPVNMTQNIDEESALSNLSKSSSYSLRSGNDGESPRRREGGIEVGDASCDRSPEESNNFSWNHLSEDLSRKSAEEQEEDRSKDDDSPVNGGGDNNLDGAGSLLQNFLIEHQRRNQNERTMANTLPLVETEYVSLEKLAETVSTCRVCNEKFRDIAQLDEHRSTAGHYQCNSSECSSLIFTTSIELSMHKSQAHGKSISPHISRNSPHLNEGSPHVNRNSPHILSSGSNTNSPHGVSLGSPNTSGVPHMNSPLASPHNTHSPHHIQSPHHHTHSPTYNPAAHLNNPAQQAAITPVNFEQLPAPVQQLAQQVQRMPLPTLPPGANTMIPGANYYAQPPGRPPPMYRMTGAPQPMHYPPHIAHLYPPYGPAPGAYPMPGPPPPQMHPQMNHQQQIPRNRYPTHIQNPRAPRIPQLASAPRQRMKRPLQPSQHPLQQQQQQRTSEISSKQRRMDLLLPDRNEDSDCHVIAQQKRNDGLPVIQNVQGAAVQQTNRNDSTIHLTDSITLSVRQPAGSNSAQVPSPASGGTPKKPDPKAVANVLAARGITVTPAASKNKSNDSQKQSASQQQPQSQQRQSNAAAPPSAVNVTALNLNSAISIIPASSQRKQQEAQQQQQHQQQSQQQQPQTQTQFAVPQNKHPPQSKQQSSNDVERPPRPPTVDLTQDTPPTAPVVRRGRPPRAMLTCQVCDKIFPNQEMLSQHMATHRTTNKLLHKCNLCPAQYPTGQALAMHKQTYHKEVDAYPPNGGIELAIPVVDLKSPQVLNRLTNLGIQSFIPLSQLSAQTGGYFGLPIITIDGARNPNACNLGALGATSILSLGPLKHLSNR